MKLIVLFVFVSIASLLSSCGNGHSADEIVSKTEKLKNQTSSQTDWKQISEIQDALRKFESDPRVYENPQVVDKQELMTNAYHAFTKARSEHPAMKMIIEEGKRSQDAAAKFKLEGNEEAYKNALAEYTASRSKLESESRQIEELKALLEVSTETEKAYKKAKYEAMKSIPEATALVAKLEALQ